MGSSGHGHGMFVTPEMADKAPIQVKRVVTDFTPFIGTGLGLYEAYTGEDIITGAKLPWWERGLNVIPVLGPIRKSAKAINAIDDLKDIAKTADKAKDGVDAVKINKTHGNKLDDKPAEGYTLRDKKTGEVKKYGETTRGEDKFGTGNQKRYTKKELKEKGVYYQKETSGTKKEMHRWQHEMIKKYKSNNKGDRPSLNKSDY
jgi:hypothetical protein